MRSLDDSLKTALAGIAAQEQAVRDAFHAAVAPLVSGAGGRIPCRLRVSVRSRYESSLFARYFQAVRLVDGKLKFEYMPHNGNPGHTPDFYELDAIVITELPYLAELISKEARNPEA